MNAMIWFLFILLNLNPYIFNSCLNSVYRIPQFSVLIVIKWCYTWNSYFPSYPIGTEYWNQLETGRRPWNDNPWVIWSCLWGCQWRFPIENHNPNFDKGFPWSIARMALYDAWLSQSRPSKTGTYVFALQHSIVVTSHDYAATTPKHLIDWWIDDRCLEGNLAHLGHHCAGNQE